MPETLDKTDLLNLLDSGIENTLKEMRSQSVSSRALFEIFEESPNTKFLQFIARFPETPSELLERLYSQFSDDADIVSAMALHPRLLSSIMQEIADSKSEVACVNLAANKALSPQTCAQLCLSNSIAVRCQVASNPALSLRLQKQLLKDSSPLVRQSLAKRKNLDPVIKAHLITDNSPFVTLAYLAQTTLDEDELLELADSDCENFQNGILLRNKSSERALSSIRLSNNKAIAKIGLSHGEISDIELWGLSQDPELLPAIAQRQDLDEKLQFLIARDNRKEVQLILAQNKSIGLKAIDQLIQKQSLPIQLELLNNNGENQSYIRQQLCNSTFEEVLLRIVIQQDLTKEELIALYNSRKPIVYFQLSRQNLFLPELSSSLVTILAQEKLPSLRCLAAASFSLEQHQWQKLARDPATKVRLIIAGNKYCPIELLSALANDIDAQVAAKAQENMNGNSISKPTAIHS